MAPAGERAADPTRRPGLTADERRHLCPPGGRPQSGAALSAMQAGTLRALYEHGTCPTGWPAP
jgi:hypothetical protein